jgi:hypothetical protein
MAGLEYEGELVIDEMLTGTAFGPTGTGGVATFAKNYRQTEGKRSAATRKFFTDDSLLRFCCRDLSIHRLTGFVHRWPQNVWGFPVADIPDELLEQVPAGRRT